MEAENVVYLENFKEYLQEKGLSKKVIREHVLNVELYIDYLSRYHSLNPINGIEQISEFLGYWFIRKCLWASVYYLKRLAASIKKFYRHLNEYGLVDDEVYEDLVETIKLYMPDWIDSMEEYDSYYL